MHEGVAFHNTPPPKVIIYLRVNAILGSKSVFGQQNKWN